MAAAKIALPSLVLYLQRQHPQPKDTNQQLENLLRRYQTNEVSKNALIQTLKQVFNQQNVSNAVKTLMKQQTNTPTPTQPQSLTDKREKQDEEEQNSTQPKQIKRKRPDTETNASSQSLATKRSKSASTATAKQDKANEPTHAAKKPDDLSSQWDVLQLTGVDLSKEEERMNLVAGQTQEASSASSLPNWSEELRRHSQTDAKLAQMCHTLGIESLGDGAAALVSEAMAERIRRILERLGGAAALRGNHLSEMFGSGTCHVTSDPRLSWRQQIAAQNAPPKSLEAIPFSAEKGSGGTPPAALAPAEEESSKTVAAALDDERRLFNLSSAATSTNSGGARVTNIGLAETIFVLGQEPVMARSRVLQWWRSTGTPLRRYARRAARTFAPFDPRDEVS